MVKLDCQFCGLEFNKTLNSGNAHRFLAYIEGCLPSSSENTIEQLINLHYLWLLLELYYIYYSTV